MNAYQSVGILAGTLTLLVAISLYFALKPEWVDRNIGKIFVIFLLIFSIQLGIACWRIPKEFRVSIIPKLEQQLTNYDKIVSKFDDDIFLLLEEQMYLEGLSTSNQRRIDIHSEIEIQRVRNKGWYKQMLKLCREEND
jgi:hypothetical protein